MTGRAFRIDRADLTIGHRFNLGHGIVRPERTTRQAPRPSRREDSTRHRSRQARRASAEVAACARWHRDPRGEAGREGGEHAPRQTERPGSARSTLPPSRPCATATRCDGRIRSRSSSPVASDRATPDVRQVRLPVRLHRSPGRGETRLHPRGREHLPRSTRGASRGLRRSRRRDARWPRHGHARRPPRSRMGRSRPRGRWT